MKHSKMLGMVAAAATTLMAFAGGTASATTLDDGKGNELAVGTTIDASLVGSARLASGGSTLVTCTGSTLKLVTDNIGGATATAYAKVEEGGLTWSGCSQTTDTIEGGTIEVHDKAAPNDRSGTVTASLFQVTVQIFSVSCTYGVSEVKTDKRHFATLTGSDTTPVLHVNLPTVKRAGSFLCPNNPTWTATYHVTSPAGLTVTAG